MTRRIPTVLILNRGKYDMQVPVIMLVSWLIIMSITGCSNLVKITNPDPNVNLSDLRSFYVARRPDDNRGIYNIIANKLNELGFNATAGWARNQASHVDAVVTYEDHWIWQYKMNIMTLDIQLRDPETYDIITSGRYFADGSSTVILMGPLFMESPEEAVDEVLRKIFYSE